MIVTELASPNMDARPGPVDMLMLHYTGMMSAQAAIDRLRDPVARVSSHYVVDEDGAVFRLVPEDMRAWHAGISYWRGRRVLNDYSVGIEIVNPGHEWGYRPFPDAQMQAVGSLCLQILGRQAIPARNVVAHSDVAPDRKQDPGELFPWQALAYDGVGLWPSDVADAGTGDVATTDAALQPVRAGLIEIGYDVASTGAHDDILAVTLRAFQRHWRPEAVTGLADAGTRARLTGLRALL